MNMPQLPVVGMCAAAIVAMAAGSPLAVGRTIEGAPSHRAMADSSLTATVCDSAGSLRWLTVDIALGKHFLGADWEPYSRPLFVGGSCQRRFGDSPLWLDASILVGRAGGVDQAGAGNGPGLSMVSLNAGLGHWWVLPTSPLSLFVGGGLSSTWMQLHVWEGKEMGHFWGGYIRTAVALSVSEEIYISIGATATVASRQALMDRYLTAGSTSVALSIGAGQ
jgi:hypothetical protein